MNTKAIIVLLFLLAVPAVAQDDPGNNDPIFLDGFESGDPGRWSIPECTPDQPKGDTDGCFEVFLQTDSGGLCRQTVCEDIDDQDGLGCVLDIEDGASGEFLVVCSDTGEQGS